MISPPPTQPQPLPIPTPPEQKRESRPEKRPIRATPLKKRMGETPMAQAIKAVLRPPIKALYYLITSIRTHRRLSLLAIVLLIASISLTTFFTTGAFPFGIGSDQWKISVNGGQADAQGELIRTWLYALRDGDAVQLSLLDSNMSSPPDVSTLLSTYSPTQTHLTWKSINVIGSYQGSDTIVDTFVSVEVGANGPSGQSSGLVFWHFITVTSSGKAYLLGVSASNRAISS